MDYQNGSHVPLSASSPPHFIFAVKSLLQSCEAWCFRPASPFKPLHSALSLSLYYHFIVLLVFKAWLLSLLKIRGHVLRSLSLSLSPALSLFLWVPQIYYKHQHCTPVFHRNHRYLKNDTWWLNLLDVGLYLAFTPVFLFHVFHRTVRLCPLLDVHLLKWDLKCQKTVLTRVTSLYASFTLRYMKTSPREFSPSSPHVFIL